jgi:hypothetical protein
VSEPTVNSDTVVRAGLVGLLAAAGLGCATAGPDGGAIAALAFGLAAAVVFGLLWTVDAAVGRPDRTAFRSVAVAACSFALLFVLASASPLAGRVPLAGYLGAGALVGAGVGATAGSPASGLWHGTYGGGVGGLLVVYVAIYESFTMRPALGGVVAIAGVLAPAALCLLGGLGGAVGAAVAGRLSPVRRT